MNKRQLKAAERLEKALNYCGKVGLQGGVFDTSFCLWPKEYDPGHNFDFFIKVEEFGIILVHNDIYLDGGAGN